MNVITRTHNDNNHGNDADNDNCNDNGNSKNNSSINDYNNSKKIMVIKYKKTIMITNIKDDDVDMNHISNDDSNVKRNTTPTRKRTKKLEEKRQLTPKIVIISEEK